MAWTCDGIGLESADNEILKICGSNIAKLDLTLARLYVVYLLRTHTTVICCVSADASLQHRCTHPAGAAASRKNESFQTKPPQK